MFLFLHSHGLLFLNILYKSIKWSPLPVLFDTGILAPISFRSPVFTVKDYFITNKHYHFVVEVDEFNGVKKSIFLAVALNREYRVDVQSPCKKMLFYFSKQRLNSIFNLCFLCCRTLNTALVNAFFWVYTDALLTSIF